MTIKKSLFSGVLALAAFVAVFGITSHQAHAQFTTGNGCPSANVFYANGYSNNYCVPSYYPGYPQTTVYNPTSGYQNTGTQGYQNVGNGYYYGNNSYGNYSNNSIYTNYGAPNYGAYTVNPYQPQNNPFQPPVYNQPFYPYNPVPTYYYPPAPTYNNGYYWGH